MKQPGRLPSLEKLGSEINALQEKTAREPKSRPRGMGVALQIGLELVSGVSVGTIIGLALDRWLGTSPLLFLICFFLGAAGGALTIYRTTTALANEEENADKE